MESPHPSRGALSLEGLLAKYNVAGPRYTSYPTAPHFSAEWDHAALAEEFWRDNKSGHSPLSLYFHLPFCEKKCWFCGCTTVITRDHSVVDAYLSDLEREMDLFAPQIDRRRKVVQIHFGGGTPTFLSPSEILRLGGAIRDRFGFAKEVEFSVEIDPRHASDEHIAALREIGCNRASLGVQDFNPDVQKAVNRIQPRELTERAVASLRRQGFASVNLDLIYGLPRQTPATFAATLEEVLELEPDRLAIFNYAHVPSIKPAQRIFDKQGELPPPEAKLRMLSLAVERLSWSGYACVGMDHFALETDELVQAQKSGTLQRNFQGYTTHAGASLFAFGLSAISQTAGAFRQNFKTLAEYRGAVRAGRLPIEKVRLLSPEDLKRASVIQRVMCDGEVSFDRLSAQLGINFETHFRPELDTMADLFVDGLLEKKEDGFAITPLGRLLVRVVAMRFDEYLKSAPGLFSKVI